MPEVEVIYATMEQQKLITVQIGGHESIRLCIEKSGVLQMYPEIDIHTVKVGVFSQVKELDDVVCPGDRIEIYRPLIADPKEVRRNKAEAAKKA